MTKPALFSDPSCVCDIAHRLTLAMRGEQYEPCPVHEPDEVARQKTDRARAQARENADRLQRVRDEMRAEDLAKAEDAETRRWASFQAAQHEALKAHDPLAATLARATGHTFPDAAPARTSPELGSGSTLGIGDTRIERILAAQLGATLNTSPDEGEWQ